ncbi:unnamed protein product [Sphagnum balticum]
MRVCEILRYFFWPLAQIAGAARIRLSHNHLGPGIWEFAWGKKFTTTKLRQSVCQNLAPSPVLEPFVDKLPRLKAIHIHNRKQLTLGAYKITQKLHRDLPPTPLYAFGASRDTASYPGPTLEARRGVESYVRFENHIHDRQHMLRVDKTLMWANPQTSSDDNDDSGGGVPIVPHLHGGEVESSSDGYPDAWFTATGGGEALHGPAYRTQNYTYANSQPATMLCKRHMLDPVSESRDPKTITTGSRWCFLKQDPIRLWKWIHQTESEEGDGAGLVSSFDVGFSAGSRKNL